MCQVGEEPCLFSNGRGDPRPSLPSGMAEGSIPGARRWDQGRTWGGLGKAGAGRKALAPPLGCGWRAFRGESVFPRQPCCRVSLCPSPFALGNSPLDSELSPQRCGPGEWGGETSVPEGFLRYNKCCTDGALPGEVPFARPLRGLRSLAQLLAGVGEEQVLGQGTWTPDNVTLVWASERPKGMCPSFTRRDLTAPGEGAASCPVVGVAKVGFSLPVQLSRKLELHHKQGLRSYKSPDTWACPIHVSPGTVFTSYPFCYKS